jgi:hypothetical protein
MNNLWQRNLPVPFFSQRENRYVWQQLDQNNNPLGEPVSLAFGSCNITSLCMILHYFGITDDSPDDMMDKFYKTVLDGSQDFRHEAYNSGQGPNRLENGHWLRLFVIENYNIPSGYIIRKAGNNGITLQEVKEKIAAGYPVWFSHGAPKGIKSGHISVIRGFTETGDLIINDPWGDIATPYGYLPSNNTGAYYVTSTWNDYNKFYGLGSGDNCILRVEEFSKIAEDNLNQSLVIEYPHVWSFPTRPERQSGTGSPFYFSLPSDVVDKTPEEERNNREMRVGPMLDRISFKNSGYPLSTHTITWHDGIHIKGYQDKPVYSVGPGRVMAARMGIEEKMPTDGSNNFVLVQHTVKIGSSIKIFYSLYMHLAPMNIAQRIRDNFVAGENTLGQSHEYDWIDQMIEHIRPKKAIVYVKGPDVLDGTELNNSDYRNALKIYKYNAVTKNMVPDIVNGVQRYLQDRSLIYLCPTDNSVQSFLEDITRDANRINSVYFDLINNIETYKIKAKIEGQNIEQDFYAFYDKTGNQNTREIRYVGKEKIIPQYINVNSFKLYRNWLRNLALGNITCFSGEDIDSYTAVRGNKTRMEVFDYIIKNVFSEITSWGTVNGVESYYKVIEKYYCDKIDKYKEEAKEHPAALHGNIEDGLDGKLLSLSVRLVTYSEKDFVDKNQVFVADREQAWITKMLGTFKVVLDKAGFNTTTANQRAQNLVNCIMVRRPTNVDYFIEVNNKTKLGAMGKYKTDDVIHLEIFSSDNIIGSTNIPPLSNYSRFYRLISSLDENSYFNKRHVIISLRDSELFSDARYFSHPNYYLSGVELLNYYQKNTVFDPAQYAVVQHLNSYSDFGEGNKWADIADKSLGWLENRGAYLDQILPYKWLSPHVLSSIKFRPNTNDFNAFFYHPIRFLQLLDMQRVT